MMQIAEEGLDFYWQKAIFQPPLNHISSPLSHSVFTKIKILHVTQVVEFNSGEAEPHLLHKLYQ